MPGRCSLELGQEHLHASNVGELALGGEEQEPGKGHGGPQGHLVSPARQAGLLRHRLIIQWKGAQFDPYFASPYLPLHAGLGKAWIMEQFPLKWMNNI